MAKRDVELTIRARDAATAAIESVKDALKDLTGVQDEVGKSATKADSRLGELGRQLRTLTAEAKGLDALGKVSGELARAGAAVSRLEGDLRSSTAEFARLARETESAAASTGRLRGAAEAEHRVLDETTAARREARKELTAANRVVKEAERNQERYNKAVAGTPETKRSPAQRSAGAFIASDLEGARGRQAALTADVAAYAAAIDRSKAALQAMGPQVDAAAAHERKLAAETAKTSAALSRQRTDLAAARTELGAISTAADHASRSLTGMALDAGKVADASARAAGEIARTKAQIAGFERLRLTFGGIADGSRSAAMGLQEVRSSVVALAAGFVSLYGAAAQIGRVLTSFQTLEGVQARLGVTFEGNGARIGAELQFLEQQAQRLGVSFGVLGDEYSKFAVAAKAANFSSEATRRIFLAVAEAGRVNRLSAEDLQGVFLALTQIISKGKVSAEELRGQLGERLPGAFNIFADALGVTTAELDKMLEQGQVFAGQGTLLKFADEFTQRFGPQLAQALRGTGAEIGRFQDNLFQAQVRVAEGGFIDAFTKGLQGLNEQFTSREGRDFFLAIGAALGRLTTVIAAVPRYFDEIALAVQVLIGLKLGSYFAGAVRSVGELRAAVVALQGTAGAATGAFRLLWSAIGGLPGLVFSGVTVALGSWLTQIDSTVGALDEHRRQMDLILGQYDRVTDKTKAWAGGIRGLTITEVESNLRRLTAAYASQFDGLEDRARNVLAVIQRFQGPLGAINRQQMVGAVGENVVRDLEAIAKAVDQVGQRQITVEGFIGTLDGIAQATADADLKALAADLIESAKAAAENGDSLETLGTAIDQAQAALRGLKGEADDSTEAIIRGGDAADEAGGSLNNAATAGDEFASKLRQIRDLVPQVGTELKRLAEIDALDKLYADAMAVARSMGEVLAATDAYDKSLNAINVRAFGGTGIESSIELLKGVEGFRSTPYWDVNALRVGYGSDTVTLDDGSVQKVVDGIAITEADAMRDLVRRIGEFQDTIKGQIGSERFNAFNSQQQAALTSVAYNYGALPRSLVAAIKQGSTEVIAGSIRGLGADNAGVNRERRQKEAALFEAGGDTPESAQILAEAEEKRVEKAKEYNLELDNRLSLQAQENANGGRLTREAFIQKELAAEQNRAREAGVTLSQERVALLTEQAGKEYDIANAQREGKGEQEEAKRALEQANALAAQRNELERQYNAARTAGDAGLMESLSAQIEQVNGELSAAIANARAMWEAIGGEAATVALTKLDTLQLKTARTKTEMGVLGLTGKQVGQLVGSAVDGAAGVFDSFAQAIASGQNAFKALGQAFLQFAADFMREIAQMILKQILLNALAGFGGPIGQVASAAGGVAMAHTGGVIGSMGAGLGNGRRRVDPAIFANAVRMHTGGIVGLRPDEVPIIAKRNEEMLTENDPRHRDNGGTMGGAPSAPQSFRHVLVLDEESALAHMTSASGERVTLSHIQKHRATIKRLLD